MDPPLKKLVGEAVERAKVAEGGGGGDASVSGVDAELLPHEGWAFCDRDSSGQQVVTHILTGERQNLPPGATWLLEMTDGFGCCLPGDASMEPLCVEDLLKQSVYTTPIGEFLVVDSRQPQEAVNLTAFATKYMEASLVLKVGTAKATQVFDIAQVRWARQPGARIFVSLKSCYERMGLSQFGGQSWRWVFAGTKNWRNRLSQLGLENHFLPSARSKVTIGGLSGSFGVLLCLQEEFGDPSNCLVQGVHTCCP